MRLAASRPLRPLSRRECGATALFGRALPYPTILMPCSGCMVRSSAGSESWAVVLPAASLSAGFSSPRRSLSARPRNVSPGPQVPDESEYFRRRPGPAEIFSLIARSVHPCSPTGVMRPLSCPLMGSAPPRAELDLGSASREDARSRLGRKRGRSCPHPMASTRHHTSQKTRRILRR
jgi:hypothetical protein